MEEIRGRVTRKMSRSSLNADNFNKIENFYKY